LGYSSMNLLTFYLVLNASSLYFLDSVKKVIYLAWGLH
jgi:hypothetical protein